MTQTAERDLSGKGPAEVHCVMRSKHPPTLRPNEIANYICNTDGIISSQGRCVIDGLPVTWSTDKGGVVFLSEFNVEEYRSDRFKLYNDILTSIIDLVTLVTAVKTRFIARYNSEFKGKSNEK